MVCRSHRCGCADFELLTGVAEAVNQLRDAGFAIVIVTNQPDVARGRQRRTVVEAMNKVVQEGSSRRHRGVLPRYFDASARRKPAPGMLLAAAEDLSLDLATASWSVTVGVTSRLAAGRLSDRVLTEVRRAPPGRARCYRGRPARRRHRILWIRQCQKEAQLPDSDRF